MRESDCCQAEVYDDSDICTCCKEHCQLVCQECEDGFIEVLDDSKIFGKEVIDVPYKKIICPNCNGEGVIEAV